MRTSTGLFRHFLHRTGNFMLPESVFEKKQTMVLLQPIDDLGIIFARYSSMLFAPPISIASNVFLK